MNILIVLLLLFCALQTSNQSCISSDQGSEYSCKICVSNDQSFDNCTYKINCKGSTCLTYNLNSVSACQNKCCNFEYSVTPQICSSLTNQFSSITLLSIIIISLGLGIPLIVLIFGCLVKLFSTNRPIQPQGARGVIKSKINVSDYDIANVGSYIMNSKDLCSICLDGSNTIMTNCGHSFHASCLSEWITKKRTCPSCVSPDFNPVKAYCIKCNLGVQLAIVKTSYQIREEQEILNLDHAVCQKCIGKNDQISIELPDEEAKNSEPYRDQGQQSTQFLKKVEEHENGTGQGLVRQNSF